MTANKSATLSDMAKVDAYENTVADYEELPEITDEHFARAVHHRDGVPVRGRPPVGDRPKKPVTIRLDQAIIDHFKALGPGWQTQMNAALAKLVSSKRTARVARKKVQPKTKRRA